MNDETARALFFAAAKTVGGEVGRGGRTGTNPAAGGSDNRGFKSPLRGHLEAIPGFYQLLGFAFRTFPPRPSSPAHLPTATDRRVTSAKPCGCVSRRVHHVKSRRCSARSREGRHLTLTPTPTPGITPNYPRYCDFNLAYVRTVVVIISFQPPG